MASRHSAFTVTIGVYTICPKLDVSYAPSALSSTCLTFSPNVLTGRAVLNNDITGQEPKVPQFFFLMGPKVDFVEDPSAR